MAAPTIFRSTDVGAPVITGAMGTAVDVLDACLVNGYGGAAATNTLTSTGVTPTAGDTVTVDGITYTFRAALTPLANEVLIGASAATALTNLAAAMGGFGTSGTTYAAGTSQTPNVIVTSVTATVLTFQARKAGTAGNAIALSKVAVTLSVGGATFSGGTAGSTKAALGWTKQFTGTFGGVYKQLAGKGMVLWVNDNGPGGGLGKEFRILGAESATSYSGTIFTGLTAAFPLVGQRATGLFGRKSVTPDTVARPWILIGDDRTFYLFILSGDTAGAYTQIGFGDYYSLLPADLYNCMVTGRATENSGTSSDALATTVTTAWNTTGFGYVARAYTGTGGSQNFQAQADSAVGNALQFPNAIDGCIYLSRIYISPYVAAAAVASRHGYFRGSYQFGHAAGNVVDGDTFTSSAGEFIGKTFMIVKTNQGGAAMVIETTAWDISV